LNFDGKAEPGFAACSSKVFLFAEMIIGSAVAIPVRLRTNGKNGQVDQNKRDVCGSG
jgi:hypothetical protein